MASNKMTIAYSPTIFILLLFCQSFSQTSSSGYSSASIHEKLHEKAGGGKRGLRKQCLDESGFIAICSEELSDDPDNDGIVSQDEFAAFLASLQCSLSSNMKSDFEACANALSFYALPLILQFLFVDAVCSQQLDAKYTTNTKDCLSSVTKNRIAGEDFGFVQFVDNNSQSKQDMERFCRSIYSNVVSEGYIIECKESDIKYGLASSSPSLVGTTPPSAGPSVQTNGLNPASSRTRNPTSLPRDSVMKDEFAPSTTPTKSSSPNQMGLSSSSSPSAAGRTSNKPSSSQQRLNERMSVRPTFNETYREDLFADSWPTVNPGSAPPSSSIGEMQYSLSFFQNGSSYSSFSPPNNGTSFMQSQDSIVNYTFVRSAAPSRKPSTSNLQSTRGATQYPSSAPSHATPRNYSSAPSLVYKSSERAESLLQATSRSSPHPSARDSVAPSRITSSIPSISSNYYSDGKSSIEPNCLTKSSFISFCSTELWSDTDEDNVISQLDFAMFLHKFEEQPCSEITPFYALPLALQLKFVESVCSQQQEDQNNTIKTDCSKNVIRNDSSGDKLGFIVATDNSPKSADRVEAFCRSIYIDVMKEGYFKGCFVGDVSPEMVASGSPISIPTVAPSKTPNHDHSSLYSRRPSPSPLGEPWLVYPTAVPARVMPGPRTVNNRTDCLTSTAFIDLCFNELLLDSDSDNIASQEEFAMFLATLPCSIATKRKNETCSREASVRAPMFYALPLTLQYHFVKAVCAQLRHENVSAEGHNCWKDAESGSFVGKPFGFSLVRKNGTVNLPVKEFCGSIYMDVVTSGGYFHECSETELAPTPSLLISSTPSDKDFYSEPSNVPSRISSSQPSSKGTSNMPTTTSFQHANAPSTEPSRLHSSMPTVHPSAIRSARPSTGIQPSLAPTYYSSSRPSSSPTLEPSFSVSSAYSSTNPTFSATYLPSRPVTHERSTVIPTDASTPRSVGSAVERDKEPSLFPTHYQSFTPTVNHLGGTALSAAPSPRRSSIPTQNPSLPRQNDWPLDNNFPSEAPSATPSQPTNAAPIVNSDGDARVAKNILSRGALFAVLTSVAGLLVLYVVVASVIANRRNNKGGNQESGTLGHFPDMHLSSDSFNGADELESAHERNDESTATIHEVDSHGGMDDLSPRQTYVTY